MKKFIDILEDIKTAYAEAVAKQKELETICNNYNVLVVGDIKHIYSCIYNIIVV